MAHSRRFEKPKTSIFGIVGKLAPWVAFVSQISGKDAAAIQSQVGIMNQLQGYANAITGRLTGITLFKSNPIQPQQTINIAGIANKWTGMGLAAMIYGEMGKHFSILPQAGKVRSIGKKVFIGGAVGGLFDDPAPGVPSQQYSSPSGYPNSTLGMSAYSVPTGSLPLVAGGNA